MWKPIVRFSTASNRPAITCLTCNRAADTRALSAPSSIAPSARQRRCFHEYFVTHIPSSSLHPDSASALNHKLPRDKSTPHETKGDSRSPAAVVGANRDMTVVRIPLKSAKHHFGVSLSRGSRPYNEDSFQAGTIEVPAFAKRRPMSLTRKGAAANEVTPADSASGDPQVFYFGVFDGHGGTVCSSFLREQLHLYLEKATQQFELQSSLKRAGPSLPGSLQDPDTAPRSQQKKDRESLDAIQTHTPPGVEKMQPPNGMDRNDLPTKERDGSIPGDSFIPQSDSIRKAEEMERELVKNWKELVGGYLSL